MTTTLTRRRTAARRPSTPSRDVAASISKLLTSTHRSIAEVASILSTNKRYVREVADREKLPTNPPTVPGGVVEQRILAYYQKHGALKTRARFRLSAPKLGRVLTNAAEK